MLVSNFAQADEEIDHDYLNTLVQDVDGVDADDDVDHDHVNELVADPVDDSDVDLD
jgi:hypothetical protein